MPEGVALEAWRRIALDPPRARGTVRATGTIRVDAADFVVEERLGFEPDGGSAHFLVRVEKRNANTLHVARGLAAGLGRAPQDIGFAGMKDRRAIARQWFTVPAAKGPEPTVGLAGDGFEVIAVLPHSRKLRRGALAGNRFCIRVRELAGDIAALTARIDSVSSAGYPNYFGAQRFGIEGANLGRVQHWLLEGGLPRGREPRAFVFSCARALAFNAVLGLRVADGSWDRLLPGEVVNLAGSASVFVADQPDEALQERCRSGDVAPTGPLCGDGGKQPVDEAGRIEATALAPLAPLPERLAAAGLRAERRALVVRPAGMRQRLTKDALELDFELPRGAFATSLLREILEVSAPDVGAE
ncbi:MAG: tRNA pseudouridine(13) synthase TruD [Steroidobacteraceae bacterium]